MPKPWTLRIVSTLMYTVVLWMHAQPAAAQTNAAASSSQAGVSGTHYLSPAATEIGSAPPKDTMPPSSPPPFDVAPSPSPAANRIINKTPKPTAQSIMTQSHPRSAWQRPFSINGTFTSGYYSSYTRGGSNENQATSFVPAGAAFDINGYYLTPDLLDYSIQPEFNASPQASDAGFQGGNGIRVRVNALRKRAFPVTLRYSNVQLEDMYFGSLSQLSSYALNNRTRELGLTTQLKHALLPTATMDWGTSSVLSRSSIPEIPDYVSHSSHRNIDLIYQQSGWNFRGFAGHQQQTSSLFTPAGDGIHSSALHQRLKQYRFSARRSFLQDSELYMDAGSQSTANLLLDRPVDLTSHHASVNLRMLQKRRWRITIRAGYTSNISDLLLTRLVGGLSGNGSIAPDPSVLQPIRRAISNLNLSGLTSLDLSRGLSAYASVDRTAVSPSGDSELNSSYLTTAGGLTYSRMFRWGHLSGQYGRSYGSGSVTGQTGRIAGQNYVVTVQPGNWEDLQLDFSIRGTDQRIFNALPAHENSFASEGSLGLRLFSQYRARFGGGWQKGAFTNAGSNFHSEGYTARIALEHPRFQINGSLNSILGNSPQAYDDVFSGIGVGSTLLTPMRIIPSDLRGVTFSLHVIPIRKLELSALYTRSIQHLGGIAANDFETIDAAATFHFRKLRFVAGFFRSAQIYASSLTAYPETQRGRFYVRISRNVQF